MANISLIKKRKLVTLFFLPKLAFSARNADNFSIIVLILNAESARLYESASIDVIVLVWDPAIFYSEQRKSRKIGILKDGLNRKKGVYIVQNERKIDIPEIHQNV